MNVVDAVIYFNLISVNVFLSFMSLYKGSDEAATKDKVRPLFQTLMHKKYNSDCLYISVLLVCMLQPWSCSWVFSMSPLNINFQLLPLTERQVMKTEVNRYGSAILIQQTFLCWYLGWGSKVIVHLFIQKALSFFKNLKRFCFFHRLREKLAWDIQCCVSC